LNKLQLTTHEWIWQSYQSPVQNAGTGQSPSCFPLGGNYR